MSLFLSLASRPNQLIILFILVKRHLVSGEQSMSSSLHKHAGHVRFLIFGSLTQASL